MTRKQNDSHSKYVYHYNTGKSHYTAAKYHEAIKSFDNAIQIKPNSMWAWNEKGNALRKLGRNREAFKCFNHAISLDKSKSYPFPYIGRGEIHRSQKSYNNAISNYNSAIQIDRHPWALNGKAHCLYATGKREEALRLADEAIMRRPSFPYPYILIGDILFDRGLYKDAQKMFEKALEITNSGYPDLRALLREKILVCQRKIASKNIHGDSSQNKNNIAALLSQLRSGNDRERVDASKNLDNCAKNNQAAQIIGHKPFPLFGTMLRDPVPEVRRNVQWLLANLARHGYSYEVSESGLLNLISANLDDHDGRVRSAAAWSLAIIAEAGQGIQVAETGMVTSCIRLLHDKNPEVRACAALALDKVALYASPDPLISENAMENLARHILDADTGVRERTIWALWSIASKGYANALCDVPNLITDLKQSAQSRNLEIRKAAVSVIGELSNVTDKSFLKNKDLERILISGIKSRSNRVRGASIWAVGRWADSGITSPLIQSGITEAIKQCREDRTMVHVFAHGESIWKERSIGGIADDVLKKINNPPEPQPVPSEPDYRTAYYLAEKYSEQLTKNELHEARKTLIHLEQCVCDQLLEIVTNQRKYLDFYIRQGINEISDEFVKEAELLKEQIHRKALA